MNQITDPPSVYDAGLDFNYANWTADTTLTLCNVPWNNDYRDIVKFENRDALNAYIDGLGTANATIENAQYARVNMPVKIDFPFNKAIRYNYLRASNPLMPISGDIKRDYYYFITDIRFIAPNTTELVVQLDVWQTFGYDVEFGNCYIERGHIGIANENQFSNFGRDYLTVPEGLNIGSEYRGVLRRRVTVMANNKHNSGVNVQDELPAVMVLSSVDLLGEHGTVDDPNIEIAQATSYGSSTTGLGLYIFPNTTSFTNFMANLTSKPWAVQGIQSITLIPQPSRYHPGFAYGTGPNGTTMFHRGGGNAIGTWGTEAWADTPEMRPVSVFTDWRNSATLLQYIPARYRHLLKLLTFPYMMIEATTWSGNALIIKPESWNDANATVLERANILPPTQRVSFIIRGYNARDVNEDDWNGDDGGEFLDMSINIDSFPTIPIMSDAGVMYLAQNAHGLAYQFDSADWSQQRALESSRVSYGQATAGIQANQAQTALSNRNARNVTDYNNQMNMQATALNGMAGVGTAAATGLVAGPAGAVAGAVGGAVSLPGQMLSAGLEAQRASGLTSMQINTANESTAINTQQASYLRDTNRDLAAFAAEGDYQNTIAAINAKTQDAQLSQPSLKGQYGGDLININHGTSELSLRWKMLDNASLAVVGEFWLRYGYAVQRFAQLPPSLMVMSEFTYWKLSETYISSAPMPEQFKQAIRGIFEKGVTVWKNPAKIGNIDIAANNPLSGVTL